MQRLAILLPFVALLVSGCATGSATETVTFASPPEPEASVAAPGEILPDAAELRVTIVDDAGLPLNDAGVVILELGLEARTGNDGWALFSNLAPGVYSLAAAKLGYSGEAKRTVVAPEESANVVFRLVALPVEAPYHETYGPMQGFFECRSAFRVAADETWTGQCGSVCLSMTGCISTLGGQLGQNDNSVLLFNLTSPNVHTIVGDMQWLQGSLATSTALRFALSHEGRASTHWWCSAQGANPLQFRYEMAGDSVCYSVGTATDPAHPTTDHMLRMYANTPFGSEQTPVYVTFQQRFEMVASVFYGDHAPKMYTGFGDG